MKHESNLRMTCGTTGLAAGLVLAACLLLTPGCGTEPPKPPESPVTTGREPVTPPQVNKAGGRRNVEVFDDLRERRAKVRQASRARS